jgi:hypothetical protein
MTEMVTYCGSAEGSNRGLPGEMTDLSSATVVSHLTLSGLQRLQGSELSQVVGFLSILHSASFICFVVRIRRLYKYSTIPGHRNAYLCLVTQITRQGLVMPMSECPKEKPVSTLSAWHTTVRTSPSFTYDGFRLPARIYYNIVGRFCNTDVKLCLSEIME